MTDVETICKVACGFYTFLSVIVKDKMSDDGHAEALSMANCMNKCHEQFGSKPAAVEGPPPYKPPPPSAPGAPPPSCMK
jgi:hypothetical protein